MTIPLLPCGSRSGELHPPPARWRVPWPALLSGWFLAFALLLPQMVWADPPGRVGRLAEATGPVWVFGPAEGQWVQAPLNRPLTQGERLSTEPGVRAELRVGSTALRLDGGSELEFVQLDDARIRVKLHAGALALRVRSADKLDEIEVLTTEGRLLPLRPGRYRIDRTDGATAVTVSVGEALFEGEGAAQTLYTRQRGEFWVDGRLGPRMQYSITEPMRDAFSGWVEGREAADERSASARFVSPEMTGAEDLERHGRWETDPQYGPLWTPFSVPPGWSPYQFGQWAWIAPWGWTWIDSQPWGFAPFHYGRWLRWRGGWAWAPGQWVARPVYAPALVGWAGSAWTAGNGSRVSIGVTVGGGLPAGPPPGWFPLAPREVFVPWYGVSAGYVQAVNLAHVPRIDGVVQIVQQPAAWVGRYPYAYRDWQPPARGVIVAPPTMYTPPAGYAPPTRYAPPPIGTPPPSPLRNPVQPPPVSAPRGEAQNPWVLPPGGPQSPDRLHAPGRTPLPAVTPQPGVTPSPGFGAPPPAVIAPPAAPPPTVFVQPPPVRMERPQDTGMARPLPPVYSGPRPMPQAPPMPAMPPMAPPSPAAPIGRPMPQLPTAAQEEAARRVGRDAATNPPNRPGGRRVEDR